MSLLPKDASLIIIFFNIFSCGIPAYLATFGPILGLRTMVFTRYSFGLSFSTFPALLNLITFIIFCVLNSIIAGQTLSQVNPDTVNVNVGIIIIAIASLIISFGGYRMLHFVERYTWIPITIAFAVLCGYSGTCSLALRSLSISGRICIYAAAFSDVERSSLIGL